MSGLAARLLGDPPGLPPLSPDRDVPIEIATSVRLAREDGPAYFD